MKYRNKSTGIIVEPASEVAEQSFASNAGYEPVAEPKKGKKNAKLPDSAGSGQQN